MVLHATVSKKLFPVDIEFSLAVRVSWLTSHNFNHLKLLSIVTDLGEYAAGINRQVFH